MQLTAEVSRTAVPVTDGNGELPPAMKWPHMEAASKLYGVLLEIVSHGVQTGGAQTAVSDTAEDQVRLYLAQLTALWRVNACLYLQVAGVTRRFLSVPDTSVLGLCSIAIMIAIMIAIYRRVLAAIAVDH